MWKSGRKEEEGYRIRNAGCVGALEMRQAEEWGRKVRHNNDGAIQQFHSPRVYFSGHGQTKLIAERTGCNSKRMEACHCLGEFRMCYVPCWDSCSGRSQGKGMIWSQRWSLLEYIRKVLQNFHQNCVHLVKLGWMRLFALLCSWEVVINMLPVSQLGSLASIWVERKIITTSILWQFMGSYTDDKSFILVALFVFIARHETYLRQSLSCATWVVLLYHGGVTITVEEFNGSRYLMTVWSSPPNSRGKCLADVSLISILSRQLILSNWGIEGF